MYYDSPLASQLRVSPSSRSTHSIAQVIAEIQRELPNHPEFRKISSAKRRSFAVDLSLVAFSIRTAHLVDIIAPNEPVKVFSQLILRLRQKTGTSLFNGIFHLHEPCSNQSFFVNNVLIHHLLDPDYVEPSPGQGSTTECPHPRWPSFVNLEDPPTLLTGPPQGLLTLLHSIPFLSSIVPPSLAIPSTPPPNQTSTIPLAALLLEYPIAYVPTSPNQTVFLSRVLLDVFELVLTFVNPHGQGDNADDAKGCNRHTLLKFSCPYGLGPPGENGGLVEKLRRCIQMRLRQAGLEHTVLLGLDHHAETLDRVAL